MKRLPPRRRDRRRPTPRARSPKGRSPLGLTLRLLVFAAVLHFLVLPQIGGTRKALSLVTSLDPALIAAAVVIEGLALTAYAQLSRALLPPTQRPGLGRMVRVVLSRSRSTTWFPEARPQAASCSTGSSPNPAPTRPEHRS